MTVYNGGQWQDKGEWFLAETEEVQVRYQEEVFHTESGDTLEQVAQGVVDAPSLEAFKARLDVALGSLVQWLVTLHIAEGLKLDDHCGPFRPMPFYDSK